MTQSKRPLFCIIDASSFIFRAYYAVRPLSNKNGLPTNAVFGFANMIIKVLEDFKPSHIAVVYDTKYPSFRKELYSEYKANRSAMPDDLVPQMPYIKKFIEVMGLPSFEMKGFEADDIIATLADKAAHMSAGEDAEVCIISSDKDLMQLVDDHIYLYDTMKEKKYDAAGVKEKMGVGPELVPDLLGIMGDSSDNIPGVRGIGPKGAVSLLEQFGSLEGIYKDLSLVKKDGQRKQLEESRENALLSKELATVKRDLELGTDWHKLKCCAVAGEELFALLQELEFAAFEKRMRAWNMDGAKSSGSMGASATAASSLNSGALSIGVETKAIPSGDQVAALQPKYSCITNLKDLDAVFESLKSSLLIALDTETTSLNIHDDNIVGFSFCGDKKNAFYVPLTHVDAEGKLLPGQCDKKAALEKLQTFLKNKKIAGQNLKFDINILRNSGVMIRADQIAFDSMLASFILEPEQRHGLDLLADKYLGHKNIKFEEVCGEGKSQILFSQAPLDKASQYAAEDAHVAYLLADVLSVKLGEVASLEKVFEEIDLPLVHVLAELEWEGVSINVPHLKKLSEEFSQELSALEKKAHDLAGGEFNLSSPKQLQKILFEDLKLTPIKKTKTGYSTDVEVLEKLAMIHELPAIILQHRELSKLMGTYVDVLPTLVHSKTGRVHAGFHQTVAATGRLSSSDPNLQNIPIRTQSGKRVREAFIAKKGCVLLGADYSQIELRILASMSGDEALCKAFQEKQDIHSLTASQIFNVSLKEVTEGQRRQAKAINFGILYGKSAFSLAEELGITRGEATDIIGRYFGRYPTIRGFIDGLVQSAKEKGYAETLFGRRRMIEGINAKNKMIQAMGERMAVNTPIQGTAADLIKLAMIRLNKALEEKKLASRLILQVHDELVLEVPAAEIDVVKPLVRECMEQAGGDKFCVPLTVDIGVAENWLKL